ncbi:MAG TPA: DEAD/DEAH box helicase family protein, partial [Sphingobacteriaceae bacterium]
KALKGQRIKDRFGLTTFFELKPFPYQEEILTKLESERIVHHRYRNLVVAATGTGKTVVSAFDYKRFRSQNQNARLLFITHRKEILLQAQETFRHVLRNENFGELWVDGLEPGNLEYVFASVQTLRNRIADLKLRPDYYDFIIIDEVHHAPANSYRFVFDRFTQKFF